MKKFRVSQLIKSAIWAMTYVFTLCVIITGIILASRLGEFIGSENTRTVIELNSKDAKQINNVESSPVQSAPAAQGGLQSGEKAQFGFEASDAQGVWEKVQQVEIFKIKYDETGNITVDGVKDKLIAPGTSNVYNFTFKNTGNVGLKYTLTTEVEFSKPEYALPVSVRLYDQNNKYLIGSATTFDDPQKLNIISETAELSAKSFSNYAFEWRWPFESGDDVYDTLLGNMAVNEDLTMTVKINVKAMADADAMGGNPYTGDSGITIYVILGIVSLCAIFILFIINKRMNEREQENG